MTNLIVDSTKLALSTLFLLLLVFIYWVLAGLYEYPIGTKLALLGLIIGAMFYTTIKRACVLLYRIKLDYYE